MRSGLLFCQKRNIVQKIARISTIRILLLAGVLLVTIPSAFSQVTYSQSFTGGSSSPAQCTAWNTYRASLPSTGITSFTIKGSNDPVGVTCTNATIAQNIADALRLGTTYSGTSDGFTWLASSACCGAELTNTGTYGNCNPGGYTVRPCIGNVNWGGVNSLTCGAASQTITVVFNTAPAGPTFDNGSPQNLTVCNNSTTNSINSLLTTTGATGGTFTWTVTSGPSHGSLSGFPATASSGTSVSPTGTSYTPTSGYNGTDAFTIQVSDGTNTATTTINVTVNPLPITGTTNVCVGSTVTLSDADAGGTWTSSSTGYATVGSSSGVVTGVSAGTVNISYTDGGGCVTSVPVTVNATPNPITGVFGTCVGSTTNLVESIGGGTWSSGTPAVATVGSTTGTVTGVAPGSSLITYAFGTGCSVSQTVTVEANPASAAYTVTPNPVCQNSSTTFSSGATPCSVNMLLFNGSTSQASLGAPITTAVDNVTMEAYISWSGTTANNQFIMLNGSSAASGYGLFLPAGSNQLAIILGGVATLTSTATIPVGPWTHVAAVRNSGTWSVYVNGVQFTVTASGTAPNVPATNFRVGSSQNANEAFNGAIDEGKFWNVAHSTSQIQADMNACNTFPQSNLLGYWRFDEVAGTTAADASANGNTLTESNIAHGGSVNLNISTYAWNFGDGGTSTNNNVGHTYTTSSNFSSTFTLTNANGCSLGSSTTVTVNPLPSAIGGTPTVCVGSTTTLSNTLAGGTWSSGTPGVATVGTASGVVSGVAPGTSVITYTSSAGCTKTITVTVNANPAAIAGTFNVCVGLTTTLTDGSSPGTWSSDNTAIATIGSSSGTVTGISAGNTFITYTMNATGCFATQAFTVNPNPASIGGSLAVCLGSTTTLNDATTGGTWSSSNGNATIGSSSGIMTGSAVGNSTITYTLPTGCINTATATVNPNPNAITGTASVCTGFTTTLNSTTGGGTWTTSDPTLATVGSSSGVVTGVGAGIATISYTLNTGCFATMSVTVNQTPVATTGTPAVCVGQTTTLSDATAGGSWSSSNPGQASVVAGTGVVTGIAAGTPNIIYTMPTGCSVTTPITVNALPAAIGGANNVCVGSSTTLTDISTPGTWTSSNPTFGSIGSSSGTVTGVSAGSLTITYTLNATGCYTTLPFTVNPTPAAITGSSTVCTGANTTLSDATTGGTWSASNGNATVVGSTGVVTGVTAGNVNIIYTLPAGCTATLPMTVNQTPVAIAGANNVCVGLTTGLSDGTVGGAWSSTNTAIGTVGTTGTVGGISAGTITISYTMPTGCYALQPFTVNPTPAAITGTLVVCQNSTTSLSDVTGGGTWSSSNTGQATVGSSSGIVTGVAAGNPNIIYTLPAGCTATATLTVNAAPDVSAFSSPTSTSPCQGGAATVTVNSSSLGVGTFTVTYNLSGANSATANTSTLTMTGSSGTFSIPSSALPNTGSTTVTITQITNSFGCTSSVSSSNTVTFTVNILPTAYTVSGTGSYCSGGTGVHVLLSNSVGGVNYQLYLNGSPVGVPLAGTFSALDFGAQTAAGTYTVIGTNTTTLCSQNMTGSAIISINPLPTAYAVTGGGSYCAGGTGVTVGLANSTIGVSYQLYVGASPSGSAVSGTGAAISFGSRTAAGTYTVVGTNTSTSCTNTMSGSATIIINPNPAAITGTLSVCTGSTTTLSSTTAGGTWTSVNTAVATVGSGSGVVTGVSSGTSVISYTIPSTGCATTATVTDNSLPAAIAGGGVVCSGSTIPLTDATGGGTWTSSNNSVASVGSSSGVVTGVAAGSVTITYTLSTGCIATTGVTVNTTPVAITGVSNVCVGSTTLLSDATPSGSWSSSNSAVAAVGTTGIVTGVSAGNATISYTLSGCITTFPMTVNAVPAAIAGSNNVCVGSTTTLTDATTSGNWSSSNTSLATIGSSSGIVTGGSAGTLTISYTLATGCFATMPFTVNVTPAAITGTSNVCVGLTTALSDATTGGTWSSSNVAIASMGSTTGIETGVSAGTATITYTMPAGGCNVTFATTVNPNPAAIGGSNQVCVGLTTALSDATTGGTWSSSNTAIGSVSGTGVVTGVAAGNVTISYVLPTGCLAVLPMTVNALPAAITGTTTVCTGFTTNLSDVTAGGSWSSSNTALATVGSSTGTVTGVSAGTPTITYTTSTGCIATTPVTVNTTPVAIVGTTHTLCTGATTTLSDATGGGTWSSSDLTKATVGSASGVVTAVAVGTPVISYTSSLGCSTTFPMTVNLQPAAITGVSNICTGATTTLSDATGGGTWASSATGVATIGTSGVVSGLTAGTTTISYTLTAGGCFSTFPMTVNQTPGAIAGTNNVCVGASTTLTDPNAGGTWTASNAFATVGSSSGIVTGVSAGNLNIIYTLPGGCTASFAMTVNPLPAAITGTPVVCVNATTTLSDVTPGGTWSSSNTGIATIGTSGIVTGVSAGNPTFSYTLTSTGCFATIAGTVNPLPTVYSVTGGGAFCSGGSGVHVGLSNSAFGFGYQLVLNGTTNIGTPVAGTNSPLDFGLETSAGTYTVIAINNATGCSIQMSGSALVTINTLPTVFTVTGGGSYCAGGSGLAIGLSNSTAGVSYQLYLGGVFSGSPVIGTGSAISFGTRTTAGAYTVAATSSAGCVSTMSGIASITINPLPTVYTVTGGGSYCAGGTGVTVGLSNSNIGINYQLFNGVTPLTTLAGTNAPLNFGLQTLTGSYTVVATNTATTCQVTMPTSVTVSINPVPATTYSVTGTGSYCSGGTGLVVGLTGSQTGVSYNLMYGGALLGAPVTGTGSAINFGAQTGAGTYTVMGTMITTGCTSTMPGNAVITINPLPTVYTISGGGGYCIGGTGVVITLSNSDVGVNYMVYDGTTLMTTIAGTGSALTYTATTAGTYTIVAQNAALCQSNMTGSALVVINPLPTAYNVGGGGNYCAGGTGVHVALSTSDFGVNYQLYVGAVPVGLPIPGNGIVLDFGAQTAAGTYTVVATNTATLCTNTMSGSAIITINPLPTVYTVTGGGSYCAGGTGVTVGLSGSDIGTSYQLYNGTGPVGAAFSGTGSAFNFGTFTGAGTYTVIATNTTTTCTNNMNGSSTISINPLPVAYLVTGGGSYCSGGTGVAIGLAGSTAGVSYQLYNGTTTSGAPLLGTGSSLNFGFMTTPGTYSVVATDPVFGCTNTMTGVATVSVNALPVAYNVTGGGAYCAGGTGMHVGLSNSNIGINYQLKLGGVALGTPMAGTGAALDFGLQTSSGVYTVTATNATFGCTNNMTGSVAITVNPLPAIFTVTGGGNYCIGGTGVAVGLTGSSAGVSYQLYNGTTPIGSPVAGTGTAITFGLQTSAGTYTVVATNGTTTCTNNMNGSATVAINPLPTVYNVVGGGAYCSGGTGVHVGLSNSDLGLSYQLYLGTLAVGSPMAGTGSALDFGLQTVAGTYTVTATNVATGCTRNMAGSASVTINPLPTAYTVTGGGSYCAGGTGVDVVLNGSDPGVNYQLYVGGTAVGISVPGTGSMLDFGVQTTAGTYTVIATMSSTACTNTMMGSASVTINALPTAYTVTGGGGYCTGGAGLHVGLSSSDMGISYQLYRGTSPVGSAIGGTGLALDFGIQTAAGVYTVVATDGVTTCTNNMTGSVTVVVNPLPTVYNVTGGGAYCAGGPGYHVGLSGSNFGIHYQLYNGTTAVGMPVAGTGFAIDFGVISLAGTYTVVATDPSSTCTSNMAGSATIVVNALPVVYTVTGGGNYCPGGAGMHVGLSGSESGVNYKLYRGTTLVATIPGNDSTLDFGLQTTAGSYTVVAANATSGCTSNMTGSAVIVVNSLPTVYSVTGGGSYCASGFGVHVSLSSSQVGVNYQLYRGTTPVDLPYAGTGILLDLGVQSFAGSYTVVATNATTGCMDTMSGAAIVAINPLPTAYTVTGGGSYCSGGVAPHIMLSGSNTGINYQLYRGSSAVGLPIGGTTGTALDFGPQGTAGTYSVVATDHFTGCASIMMDTIAVSVNPLPAVYSVIGGGSYCAGGTGVNVGLTNSDTTISYQLYKDGAILGAAVTGTGGPLNFGSQTAAGSYTVVAMDIATGCTRNMVGSAMVSINALPSVYTVTGGGSYCAGGSGLHVGLSGSSLGISYQLQNGGTSVGSAVTGTGLLLDFGLLTTAGSYAVVATNTTTGCINKMADTVSIAVNALPLAYTITGGGSYCSGTSGINVGLSNSDAGIRYQLYNGTTSMGSPVVGVSGALSFGLQTLGGTYTVVGTNIATGCTNNMTGSTTVTVTPTVTPSVTIGTGVGDTVCAGTSVTFTPVASNAGSTPIYQWSVNGAYYATAPSINYTPINGDTIGVMLTSSAACASPATVTGTVIMTALANQTPTVTVYVSPGDSLCGATPVTMTLSSTWGGASPSYTWFLNGSIMGTGTTFALTPSNGDVVFVVMSSNYKCVTDTGAMSNNISFNVDQPDTPHVTITQYQMAAVDSYQVSVTNDPTHVYNYTYQWYINGTIQTLATSSYLLLAPGSVPLGSQITCVVTRRNHCGVFPGYATFDLVANVGVTPVTMTIGDIRVVPNPNKGIFTLKGSLGVQTDEEVSVDITDMLGQVVYTQHILAKNGELNDRIELNSRLANGMYILTMHSASGSKVVHLVVEQ